MKKTNLLIIFFICFWGINNLIAQETEFCGISQTDSLGPYYISGVPFRNYLVEDEKLQNRKAIQVTLKGKVLDVFSHNPLKDVQVEIWHADEKGMYWPRTGGKSKDFREQDLKFRARGTSSSQGDFFFKTILPGKYVSRPRHYHFKFSKLGFDPLVTQVYFSEDKQAVKNDILAKAVEGCRFFSFKKKSSEKIISLHFFLQEK